MTIVPYFAYGTLRVGLPNYERFAEVLGERVCRVRTADAFAVVVPKEPGCSNPGCGLLHRMAALVPGVEPLRTEGDLFLVDEDGLAALDQLEGCANDAEGPYERQEIELVGLDDERSWRAQAYPVRDATAWRALLERGAADALAKFDPELAVGSEPKDCCVRQPGHAGPHDVVDPLLAG